MRLFVCLVAVCLAGGCALRPRYSDLISPTSTQETVLQVTDRSGAPLKGVRVEIGESKNRVVATTRDDGTFTLPYDKKLQADDALFVVSVPQGVDGYVLKLAPPPPPPAPAVDGAPVAP
jgi:hypothetical protein